LGKEKLNLEAENKQRDLCSKKNVRVQHPAITPPHDYVLQPFKKNIVQSLLLETKQLHVLSSFPPCHVKAVVTLIGLQLRQMTRLSVSSLLMW
jgi:hypothetical protein